MQEVNAAYCLAVGALIRHPGDAEGAIQTAQNWCLKHASPDVRGWLEVALGGEPLPPVAGSGTDGWVRWAFQLSFRCGFSSD